MQLLSFDASNAGIGEVAGAWAALAAIAVGGSLIYGGSIGLVVEGWRPGPAGIWMALSAGLAWCIFGPALVLITRIRMLTCGQACLVTMAYGEGVLVSGAVLNAVHVYAAVGIDPVTFNFNCVALANAVMAATLTLQLNGLGVAWWKTLAAWMIFLNGTGAVCFYLVSRLLRTN